MVTHQRISIFKRGEVAGAPTLSASTHHAPCPSLLPHSHNTAPSYRSLAPPDRTYIQDESPFSLDLHPPPPLNFLLPRQFTIVDFYVGLESLLAVSFLSIILNLPILLPLPALLDDPLNLRILPELVVPEEA